ncbi:MAG: hypothetical protein LQ338_001488 [Usnochroma carphineum]|nr:MAG: hypothetical protein LQ338_001488 [Usnochroma carphineum]
MDDQGWQKTKLNTVNRYRNRVNTIVDETPILHVSFASSAADGEPPFPLILPMVGCTSAYPDPPHPAKSESRVVYLHGSATSRIIRLAKSADEAGTNDGVNEAAEEPHRGIPICVAATQLDGIVLALTPNHHSCNYRSAVLFGHAHIVTDEAERLHALELLTDNLVPSRWENTRYPNATELKSTGILRVEVESASAKIRTGTTGEDRGDVKDEELRRRVWSGVVPASLQLGKPVAAPTDLSGEVPKYIGEWVEGRNQRSEQYAHDVAK